LTAEIRDSSDAKNSWSVGAIRRKKQNKEMQDIQYVFAFNTSSGQSKSDERLCVSSQLNLTIPFLWHNFIRTLV